ASAVRADAARFGKGIAQVLGKFDLLHEGIELPRLELDQGDADILQRVHGRLAPGLRWRTLFLAGSVQVVAHSGAMAQFVGTGHGLARLHVRKRPSFPIRKRGLVCYHSSRTPTLRHPRTMTRMQSSSTDPAARDRALQPGGPEVEERFPLPRGELECIAQAVLDTARAGGATAAETDVSQAVGLSVTVRKDEVETIAYNRDKGIGVTVYIGQRRGHASTADFADDAIRSTVEKALTIARYTAEDPASGLADPDRLARAFPDLDLYHPWDLTVEHAIALGREAESAALAVDKRLTNTEGSTVARSESEFVYGNSNGFLHGYRNSRHHIDCSVIGED